MRKYEIEKMGIIRSLLKIIMWFLIAEFGCNFIANNKLFILFLSINGYNENVINKICFMRHAVGPFKYLAIQILGCTKGSGNMIASQCRITLNAKN